MTEEYWAAGLDTLGTYQPLPAFDIEGNIIGINPGPYLQISYELYRTAIDYLVQGKHVCVVGDELILDYQLPVEDPPNDNE